MTTGELKAEVRAAPPTHPSQASRGQGIHDSKTDTAFGLILRQYSPDPFRRRATPFANVPVRVIGVKSDVESADADEFDGTPVAECTPCVAGMPRVFGDPFKGREKLAKLHVFARTQRGHRGFIQREAIARHLRRLCAPLREHRLELIFREAASRVDSSREFFEKFRVVETAQVFEIAGDSFPILARELGQLVDDRVAVHAGRMPAAPAFAKPF